MKANRERRRTAGEDRLLKTQLYLGVYPLVKTPKTAIPLILAQGIYQSIL
jgi:hypothetical protein